MKNYRYPKRTYDIIAEIERLKQKICKLQEECCTDEVGLTCAESGLEIVNECIYLGGLLLRDTTINGDSGLSFRFQELFNLTLEITNEFFINYPTGGNYINGAVLTLADNSTGLVEFKKIKHVETFEIADWVGNAPATFTIPKTTHNIDNPTVEVYIGTTAFTKLGTDKVSVKINASEDVILELVPPETEFDGKVIII